MMSIKNIFISSSLVLFLASFSACKHTPTDTETAAPATEPQKAQEMVAQEAIQQVPSSPATLPVRYQTPSYMVDMNSRDDFVEEESSTLKVGASIRSTRGPQPLWDILKRLAALKKMNVSWASDVDQNVLVDVDINANDDFYGSIDNLLRQVDFFHEMQGNTIVVKYKETKRFHVAMPFTKQNYSTGTGGNLLGSDETSNNIDGTIEIKSANNEFDIWKNVQDNMDAIINTWNTTATTTPPVQEPEGDEAGAAADTGETSIATRQVSAGGSMYIIDKPIGMITVTAPRPLLSRLDTYFKTLKEELYKQITIEAKIIEVQLNDTSTVGINWSSVLKNFNVSGTVAFGYNGQVYPFISANENDNGNGYAFNDTGSDYDTYSDIGAHTSLSDPGRFISKVTLGSKNFDVFLNALKEQGDTKILSNPKLSVMNGQPAMITVGRNVTYVDSIESDLDSETGIISYSVETERILSGIGMALTATVLDNKQIIMNLVPVTSELVEPIEYLAVGNLGAQVGLPIVNVRELSTTVKVNDGEMLVIGGLISNVDESNGEFAPVLGDIPLLRYLFGYEEKVAQKRELIILLKPRII
ncbi:pilus (MSHA type) biogenesis protein MshL [Desulfosediminicola flagellatus]|uniref:pilus (MSHA type) biogenesis protein MshL n=1 Tax=Desulfosediminicola flagellatus TaxID=2569541 RepID=UPI0010AD1852|nr:pilus (MSHA type) biogenesis protein MshL [Desulfosediminicola flagellatus]